MKLKRILPLMLTAAAAVGYGSFSLVNAENTDIAVNETNFPDAVFRGYISAEYDSDNNGVLSAEEAAKAHTMYLNDMGISSLKGIELLTELENLSCDGNNITSIDLSRSRGLENLSCRRNMLSYLDLSANTSLEYLACDENDLTSLDLSGNTSLKGLCCGGNKLTELNLNGLNSLAILCCTNNDITALDVSGSPVLTELECGNNALAYLDVSRNTALETLECAGNRLVSLDVSGNSRLQALNCPDNRLSSLVIGSKDALKILNCRRNSVTSLDLSSCNDIELLLTDSGVNVIAAEKHTHNPSAEWYSDGTAHWRQCECGEKTDIASHISDGGRITVQPTAASTGVRTYSCSVCGYVMNTETIPAGGSGYISDDTPYVTPSFPVTQVVTDASTPQLTVKAEVKKNAVTLTWNKIKGAKNYTVYQYKDGKYVPVKTTEKTAVKFVNLKNGKTYKFLVRYTMNGKLSSTADSGKVSAAIRYKPIVKAASTENSVTLKWSSVEGAEKYAVYKYENGKTVKLTETQKRAVKYSKLDPHKKYSYVVRAYVDGKWTPMSKSDIVTIETE